MHLDKMLKQSGAYSQADKISTFVPSGGEYFQSANSQFGMGSFPVGNFNLSDVKVFTPSTASDMSTVDSKLCDKDSNFLAPSQFTV